MPFAPPSTHTEKTLTLRETLLSYINEIESHIEVKFLEVEFLFYLSVAMSIAGSLIFFLLSVLQKTYKPKQINYLKFLNLSILCICIASLLVVLQSLRKLQF